MTKRDMIIFLEGLHGSIQQLHATTLEPKTGYVFEKCGKLLQVIHQLRLEEKEANHEIN